MTEEEIVKKVCEMMNVHYSHYDNHKMGLDYFRFNTIKFIPKIVVYSESFGMWQFAILEDMSVLTSTSEHLESLINIAEKLKELNALDGESLKIYEKNIAERNKYQEIQKWLIDNGYDKVINNSSKKINL